MITNIETNFINISREMCAIMDRMEIQAKGIAKAIKEQSSRQLSSDIKNDDIREFENVTLSLEEELTSLTLVEKNELAIEDKYIMGCHIVLLIIKEEIQALSLVEKN